MKSLKTTAMLALMTTAVGLSAIAPSYAQEATPPAPPSATDSATPGQGPMAGQRPHDGNRDGDRDGPRQGGQRQGDPRGMSSLIGFERGAEAVEIALVRLSHAVDMTDEQQALFDTLKTDALTAAETFSAAIEELRPAQGEQPQAFDLATGLDTRIAIQTAQLDALKAVQPSLTAFFASLTDEQKAELTPQPRGRGAMGEHGRSDHKGQHQGRGPGPMGTPELESPATPNG